MHDLGLASRFADSTEAANHQIVPVGAVETQHVHDGFTLRRVNDLANAQERFATRNGEELGDVRVGSSGVHFFISVTKLDSVIALEDAKQRSEEHTSELQSRLHLVCRLLLEKTKIQRLLDVDQ